MKLILIEILLTWELFNVRKIYVVNLKTSCPQKMPYVGEFPTWDITVVAFLAFMTSKMEKDGATWIFTSK